MSQNRTIMLFSSKTDILNKQKIPLLAIFYLEVFMSRLEVDTKNNLNNFPKLLVRYIKDVFYNIHQDFDVDNIFLKD